MPASSDYSSGKIESSIKPVLDRLMEPFKHIQLDPDRHYSRNHLWLQRQNHRRWRLGLDLFSAGILGQVSEIIYPTYKNSQQRGSQLLWINCMNGMIMIRSPVAVTALQKNQQLRDNPSLLLADPQGEGWLVDGEFRIDEHSEYIIPNHLSARWMGQELEWLCQELRQQILNKIEHGMGETLEDGGVYVTDIYTALGPLAHRDLMNRVINLP
jgi:glycine cleavage system H protein